MLSLYSKKHNTIGSKVHSEKNSRFSITSLVTPSLQTS